ncbi:MAG TPA: S-methyl-5'-thioadenosine phosphorylase [Halobacteria archaeon]|jgi:5'-methylthioadenosine phosphorylase|nr:S-methyl-5'-thioadenosine phosphorylase [Halobacteria archaeon]
MREDSEGLKKIEKVDIGIIGGSGVYDPDIFEDSKEINLDTPFGKPTSVISLGWVRDKRVAFISRHGRGHIYSPTKVNYMANIFAFKKLGVQDIISVCSVGSLREDIKPLDIVIPDQIYDRTKNRANTFFEDLVAHISFAEPFCKRLSRTIYDLAVKKGYTGIKQGGTYVCIEGPQFSTKAESNVYRRLGFDLVGMTAIPEAKLAREAEICYATLAMVTDYDVWREKEEVSVSLVEENVGLNVAKVKAILKDIIPDLKNAECECKNSLSDAVITNLNFLDKNDLESLSIFLKKYV